jgi:hypothetical protein
VIQLMHPRVGMQHVPSWMLVIKLNGPLRRPIQMLWLKETVFRLDADRPRRVRYRRKPNEERAWLNRQPDRLEQILRFQLQRGTKVVLETPHEIANCVSHGRRRVKMATSPGGLFETSDNNPNVMIEMGVALTWDRRVFPIKKKGRPKPPSDISGQTVGRLRRKDVQVRRREPSREYGCDDTQST